MTTRPPIHKPHRVKAPTHGPSPAVYRQHQRDLPTNSARWRKIRAIQLDEEPLCRMCKAEGRVTEATEVDHINGEHLGHDRANLQSLCKPHHSAKTAREMKR